MADRIVSCECGVSVRLPNETANRAYRCPKCKAPLPLTANAAALPASRLAGEGEGATCPICQTELVAEEVVVTCPKCDQVHHEECWSEIGGCGTYGCEQAPAIDKSEATAAAPRSQWGDTKKCPMCGEEIKAIALRCRYCDTDFNTADPLTLKDMKRQAVQETKVKGMQQTTLTIFIVSLLGCLAPIVGPIAAANFLPQERRQLLKKCGPLHQIMAWASLILSAVYTVLMLLFWLFGN